MTFFYISKSKTSINLAQIIRVEWRGDESGIAGTIHLSPEVSGNSPNLKSVEGEDADKLWALLNPDQLPTIVDLVAFYKGAL